MNALFDGNFFDGSPEHIFIWMIVGILLGIPLFYGRNKSHEINEGDKNKSANAYKKNWRKKRKRQKQKKVKKVS